MRRVCVRVLLLLPRLLQLEPLLPLRLDRVDEVCLGTKDEVLRSWSGAQEGPSMDASVEIHELRCVYSALKSCCCDDGTYPLRFEKKRSSSASVPREFTPCDTIVLGIAHISDETPRLCATGSDFSQDL